MLSEVAESILSTVASGRANARCTAATERPHACQAACAPASAVGRKLRGPQGGAAGRCVLGARVGSGS